MEAKLGVEKLNNENYAQWAFETEMLLIREKLWKYVEYAQAPVPENDEWTDGVQRARATISLLVERRQHPLIRELRTAKEVWLKLKNEHQKTSMCSRVSLICQICDRKLPEGGDVATHIYDLEELFAKLRSAGKDLGEDVQVAMLLRSLPMSYDQVRTALLIMKDEDLKLDYVKGKILDQERKMNEGEAGDTPVAYKVAFKRKLICYGCGKEGHRKVDCPAEMSDDDVEVNASASVKKSYAFVLDTSKRQEWIVDSGASSHVCCVKACFDSLKPAPRGQVLLANGKEVDVQGIGTVSLNSVDNNGEQTVIKLTDVLYIQGLEMNLISVAKLIVKGADIRFGKHGCRIMSRGETAAVAVLRDGLYRLKQRRWRSGQQKEIGTQFVGVLIESKRRSKKSKKREVFEYTLSGAPSLGQRKMEDPVQYHEDVVQPVYFFRASSKRRVSGRTKRKGPVERNGTVPKSRRLADPDEDENKLSRIQEELEILTIGTRKNEA